MTAKERADQLVEDCQLEEDVHACRKCIESAILAAQREAYEDAIAIAGGVWPEGIAYPWRVIAEQIRARMNEVCK